MVSNGSFVSYIFLEMETTGLRRPIEITELSLVAIQKNHLLAAARSEELGNNRPRIFDKLHLCVRPIKEIEGVASMLTRIDDDDLSLKKPFDKQLACMIRAFVLRQPQPACVIAHWGDRYDFDILASQFTKVGSKFPSVPVSDSYKAFKKLHKQTHGIKRGKRGLDIPKVSFSLQNLYLREMGQHIKDRFTVEGDSMALIELVIKKPEVLDYIERGAHPLGRGEKNQAWAECDMDDELIDSRKKRRKTAFVDLTLDL